MKYFEGFYVKCAGKVDDIAVIFGRQEAKNKKSCFIQIITNNKTFATTYSGECACCFRQKPFLAKAGESLADKSGLYINVDEPGFVARGKVSFGEFKPIKYDPMGPLKLLPKMECKHMVVSMHHDICGSITINDQVYNFDGGVGYIEGDKGCSFPQKYFWSQANDYTKEIYLFASAARIPYLGIRFMGTICVAMYKGKEYRFASYLGASVKVIEDKKLLVKQGRMMLEIDVLDDKSPLPLAAPNLGTMTRTIKESLDRIIRYRLTKGKDTLFDFTSDRAAHEYSCALNE